MSRTAIIGPGTGRHQPSSSAAAGLATLPAGGAGFVFGPFVGRALLVRGATTLTGDLTLLFGRHRTKSATFFVKFLHGTTSKGIAKNPD
jgi:hypothetical protein